MVIVFFFNFGENIKKSVFRIILVLFVILNLHFAILNFSKLILEGAESNPGPNAKVLRKTLLATCHQGYEKYRDSVGRQCTAMAYFSIIFSVMKRLSHWGVLNLDYILDKGGQIYQLTGIATAVLVDELPLNVKVADWAIKSEMLLEKVLYLAVVISCFTDTSL